MKILVRREAARGDVLVASAVVPALKKKYDGCKIAFYTKCPSVLTKNIYIDFVTDSSDILEEEFDLRIDLDMAYENRPTTHVLQAYADVAQVPIEDCKLYIHCERVNMPLFNNYVVIHAGITNWVGRNWSNEGWRSLALQLHDKGYQIVCVGAGGDRFVPSDADVRNKATINEVATIMKGAKLFVGIDSLPMHIAQAVGTPGVVFFGSIRPDLRLINSNMEAIVAKNLSCLGCHHKKACSTVTDVCETGTLDCEHLVSTDQMVERVLLRLNCLSLPLLS
jgi:ADP-heptose:LPS heptosyltransferase